MNIVKAPLLLALALYRKLISPILPSSCRFYPSCSQYATDAIHKHGAGRGIVMATRRVARCHPWNPGGADPVIEPGKPKEVS